MAAEQSSIYGSKLLMDFDLIISIGLHGKDYTAEQLDTPIMIEDGKYDFYILSNSNLGDIAWSHSNFCEIINTSRIINMTDTLSNLQTKLLQYSCDIKSGNCDDWIPKWNIYHNKYFNKKYSYVFGEHSFDFLKINYIKDKNVLEYIKILKQIQINILNGKYDETFTNTILKLIEQKYFDDLLYNTEEESGISIEDETKIINMEKALNYIHNGNLRDGILKIYYEDESELKINNPTIPRDVLFKVISDSCKISNILFIDSSCSGVDEDIESEIEPYIKFDIAPGGGKSRKTKRKRPKKKTKRRKSYKK
jgi:hypothetical protein